MVCCLRGQNRNLKHQQLSDCLCQTNGLSKLNPLTNLRVFVDRDGSKTNDDLTLVRILGIGMIVKTTSREEREGDDCFLESVSEYTYIHICIQRVYIYMDRETTSRAESEGGDCFPVSAGSFSPGVDSLCSLLLHHPTSLGYLTLH